MRNRATAGAATCPVLGSGLIGSALSGDWLGLTIVQGFLGQRFGQAFVWQWFVLGGNDLTQGGLVRVWW